MTDTNKDGADGVVSTNWLADRIGFTDDGQLVLKEDEASNLCRMAPIELWCEAMQKKYTYETELETLQHRINSREPDRFLPKAIAELEERAKEANSLRGEGVAGKIMWGQAQAYRDAIALLQSYFR